MFSNSDGKKFSSKFRMNRHAAAHEPEEKAEKEAPEQDGEAEEPESAPAIAKEHGPATEVNIKHEEGKHHVSSKHPDGHSHKSEHSSPEEAHAHGAGLAGVQVPGQEEAEPPAGDEQDSFQVPGLD